MSRSKSRVLIGALFFCAVNCAAQTVNQYLQNDARITYTGTWYPSSNSLELGGSSTLANLKGSQAIVTFNGTGIAWIGTSDPYSGYCYLDLDGVPAQVDTGSATTTNYTATLYQVHNLAPGLHTMTIEITHSHDENTNQSWIWVNAFNIDNGSLVAPGTAAATAGTVTQASPAINWGGHWFQLSGSAYSGGSANEAVDSSAWATLNFNGTGVTWIGYRDAYSGIAQVSLDGGTAVNVDTYSSTTQAQSPAYTVTGLAAGPHTLKISVTGTQNPNSGGAWVWINGFTIIGGIAGPPSVNAGGVVNAASYVAAPNNQVAPGQIVSIFGSNFMASGSASASMLPLPVSLGNVSVSACGENIPLFAVYPNQINAQVPTTCAASGSQQLTVTAAGQTSAAQTMNLSAASPGIFTVNGAGSGDAVILHGNNSLVNAANPAKAGEQVVIYSTGLGPTTPAIATGAAATANATTVNPVTVTIGGQNATVVYSGLTAGFAGLYQVNVLVPAGLNGSQAVVMRVNGASSAAGVNVSVTP